MQRFKSVLAVVTEDSLSEVALERAVALARENGAALTLVDVIDSAPGELARLLGVLSGRRGAAVEDDVIAYHRDRLSALAEKARAAQVEVTEAVLQGSGFVEVIRMVLREGHDIVIKGATRTEDGGGVLKGFDMHLLRKCPCPVWMLMGQEDGCFDRIVAAIDPSAGPNDPRAALDALVLDLATGLASRDAAEVHVVHAWYLPEEQALRHGRFAKSYAGEVDMLVTREEAAARARVAEVMRPYTDVQPRNIVVRKGHPGDVVADYATGVSADVIVMGTVGRTGLNGFVMGNTAETVLNRISCAVIAVKPEGFVSPVTLGPAG